MKGGNSQGKEEEEEVNVRFHREFGRSKDEGRGEGGGRGGKGPREEVNALSCLHVHHLH